MMRNRKDGKEGEFDAQRGSCFELGCSTPRLLLSQQAAVGQSSIPRRIVYNPQLQLLTSLSLGARNGFLNIVRFIVKSQPIPFAPWILPEDLVPRVEGTTIDLIHVEYTPIQRDKDLALAHPHVVRTNRIITKVADLAHPRGDHHHSDN